MSAEDIAASGVSAADFVANLKAVGSLGGVSVSKNEPAAPLNWDPPAGMDRLTATAWRTFYRRALDVYGVTPYDYRLLYIVQKGRCWICRKAKGIHPDDPKGRGARRLGIDHDHLTGEVRGLLCTGSLSANTCNRLIAIYSREALERAAGYLADPPARVLKEAREVVSRTKEDGAPWSDEEMERLLRSMLWVGEAET